MGSNCVQDAKFWLKQQTSAPSKIASLIIYCINGNMVPRQIKISSDLFLEMVETEAKETGHKVDLDNMPGTVEVILGKHIINLVHDSEMLAGSMHAVKNTN